MGSGGLRLNGKGTKSEGSPFRCMRIPSARPINARFKKKGGGGAGGGSRLRRARSSSPGEEVEVVPLIRLDFFWLVFSEVEALSGEENQKLNFIKS